MDIQADYQSLTIWQRSLVTYLSELQASSWSTCLTYRVAPVMGCTDPTASNYNPNATINDGSCVYPPAAVKWATSFDGTGPALVATTGASIAPSQSWSNGAFANGTITTNNNTSYPWTFGTISKLVLKGVTFSISDSFNYTRITSHFVIKPDGSVVFSLNNIEHPTGVVLAKGQKYASIELPVPAVGANSTTSILGGPINTGSSCLMTLESMEVYG